MENKTKPKLNANPTNMFWTSFDPVRYDDAVEKIFMKKIGGLIYFIFHLVDRMNLININFIRQYPIEATEI